MNLKTATSTLKNVKDTAMILVFAYTAITGAKALYTLGVELKECASERIDEWTESE